MLRRNGMKTAQRLLSAVNRRHSNRALTAPIVSNCTTTDNACCNVSFFSTVSFSAEDFESSTAVESKEAPVALELEQVEEDAEVGFSGQKDISEFDLSSETKRNLRKAGIDSLFPVQVQSFDIMMSGEDIMGRSKTGSGKTLAFALPIVEKIIAQRNSISGGDQSGNPKAMVLLPTRELSLQVSREFERIAPQLDTLNIVGGVSYDRQINSLSRGVDIIVGTPGRIIDLMSKQALDLSEVQFAVLDEADMMLKFGFQEAVEEIIDEIPKERQCVLWSATVPSWVSSMAKNFLNKPVNIDLVGHNRTHLPTTVSHRAIMTNRNSRTQILEAVLKIHGSDGQSIVFTETKHEVDKISEVMGSETCKALHGDLSQGMRQATMDAFRSGKARTLICTDIAARGLDIAGVDLVVQYRLPNDKESFVHRAGRTGRAGRSGKNIVIFDESDRMEIVDVQKRFGIKFIHAASPDPDLLLQHSINGITANLEKIPPTATKAFDGMAEKLLQENGSQILSAALAMLSGHHKEMPRCFSMLNGKPNMQTVLVSGARSPSEVTSALRRYLPSDEGRFRRGSGNLVHNVDGDFVVDINSKNIKEVIDTFSGDNDLTVTLPRELPSLILPRSNGFNSDRSNYRGGNGRGGRNGGFRNGGRGDNRFGGRSGGRSGGRYGDDFGGDFGRGSNSRSRGRDEGRNQNRNNRSFGGENRGRKSSFFGDRNDKGFKKSSTSNDLFGKW